MKCKKPYMYNGQVPFGCGQCTHCRINKRRLWTARMILESYLHPYSAFVTLTYAPEHLPADGSLSKKHYQDWLKRLRYFLGDEKVRYYLVGEYGDQTFRPHYHAILFGFPPCAFNSKWTEKCMCSSCKIIRESWTFGASQVGTCEPDSIHYVTGYISKKMTKKEDPRLGNRMPEFARMSLKPGIGSEAMLKIAEFLTTSSGAEFISRSGDVPINVTTNGKNFPLGRYLRKKLREIMGFPNVNAQEGWYEKAKAAAEEEVLQLLVADGSLEIYKTKTEKMSWLSEEEKINYIVSSANRLYHIVNSNKDYITQLESKEALGRMKRNI